MTTLGYTQGSITINNGETIKTIDLTPVNALIGKLEIITSRKSWKDRKHIPVMDEVLEDYKKLNDEQKMYAFNHLLGDFARIYDAYLSVLEDPKSALEWKEFLDKIPEDYKKLRQPPYPTAED